MTETLVPRPAPRQPAEPFEVLAGGLRRATLDGAAGVDVSLRLGLYRSLPLSCLHGLELAIDGVAVDIATTLLSFDGHRYRLAELAERTDLWWYILDTAELFVPTPTPLAPGTHHLEAVMTLLVPFATAGRTTHTTHSAIDAVLA